MYKQQCPMNAENRAFTTVFIDVGKIGFAFWPKLKLTSH